MIDEGVGAPAFTLPAVVNGEIEQIALADYLGSDVVILAFYPADFNPACDGEETDLDELDLFTMQKDVSILAVSADSVYSHRAFAAEYDLHIPLLADTAGEVAEDYGVALEDPTAGYRTKRAVVVIGPGGDVEYAWSTDDLHQLPPVDRVREAVDSVGGSETAVARYRVGHAHYVEGRRAFTSAMGCFADEEWMMAKSDFARAYEEFEEAADHFNTAVRFGEDEVAVAHFERAEDKAELLWQAAEWLTDAASAFASGEGAQGQAMRKDAEAPLEEARRYGDPIEPDDFPPAEPPAPLEEQAEESDTFLPDDDETVEASLDVDLDEDAYADDDLRASVEDGEDEAAEAPAGSDALRPGSATAGERVAVDGETDGSTPSGEGAAGAAAAGPGADGEPTEGGGDEGSEDTEDSIDEAELEEITAELEQQTEAAQAEHDRETAATEAAEDAAAEPDGEGEDRGDEADEAVEEGDVELDLTDPTEGEGLDPLADEDEADEDADEEDDLGDSGHGVPDSL